MSLRPTSNRPAANRLTVALAAVALAMAATGTPGVAGASPLSSTVRSASHIVYQSDDGIHIMLADGSTDDRLLGVGAGATHPDWSPDGARLAYAKDGTEEFWTSNADGTDQTRVVACDPGCDFLDNPAWSPDGTQMAYVRFASADGLFTGSSVEVLDLATGSHRSVVGSAAPDFVYSPRWSPGGRSLVVEVDRYPDEPLLVDQLHTVVGNAIGVVDVGGSGPGALDVITDWEIFAAYPDWHPTDDLIVFNTYDLGGFEQTDEPSNLYTIRPDGSELTQLTTFGRADTRATQPTWTPDGQRMIFTQVGQEAGDFDQPRQVAFVGRDGSGITVLDAINRTHARLRPTH